MIHSYLVFALTVFTGFFAIMNPIANTPVFLGLTEGYDKETKKKVARKATIVAFIIGTSFTVLGKYIFDIFGITIPAFKITGGILIFYVGFEMLMSVKSKVHNLNTKVKEEDTGIAISPLAIPILAGPGTIVTAMNYVNNTNFLHVGIVIAIFALMVFLTYLSFSLSDQIVKRLGENFIKIIGKLMGLILAIIGTDMVIQGIKIAFGLH